MDIDSGFVRSLLLPIAAATGIVFVSGERARTLDPPTNQKGSKGTAAAAVGSPLAKASPSPPAIEKDSIELAIDPYLLDCADSSLAKSGMTILVATLPDPESSGLGFILDRNLEVIQRALEVIGYSRERSWLPWPRRSGVQAEATPGIVVFRNWKTDQVLALLIVGETPTAGVHPKALDVALRAIPRIAQADLCDLRRLVQLITEPVAAGRVTRPRSMACPPEVRILGPSFSGSAHSLESRLAAWDAKCSHAPRYTIVSGSATAISPDHRLRKRGFRATVLSDRTMTGAMVELMEEQGAKTKDVAILHEANTIFGQHVSELAGGWLSVPFPLHIHRIAEAHENLEAAEAGTMLPSRSVLPLARDADKDHPTSLSPMSRTELSSRDLVLTMILNTLRRERVRYVGLFATDVRDRLFLAREIRKHCPDTRLFTFGADVLYTHPSHRQDVEGMLVLSPYPLFSMNQLWTFPFGGERRRMEFPSSSALGVYNATLAVLDRTDQLLEYHTPFAPRGSAEPGPALWVSAVGWNGTWPIAIRKYIPDDYVVSRSSSPGEKEIGKPDTRWSGGIGFEVLLCVTLVITALFCFALSEGAPIRLPPEFIAVQPLLALLHLPAREAGSDAPPREFARQRAGTRFVLWSIVFSLAVTLALAFAAPLLLALVGLGKLSGGANDFLSWMTLALTVLVLPPFVLWGLWRQSRLTREVQATARQESPRRRFWYVLVILLGWGGASILVAVLLYHHGHAGPLGVVFMLLRARTLDSGLSPLLPMLLVAIAGATLCFYNLARFRLLEQISLPPSFSEYFATGPLVRLEAMVRASVRGSARRLPGFWLVILLLVLLFVFEFRGTTVPGVDGLWYDRVSAVGMFFLYAGLITSFVRFATVWAGLKRFLVTAADEPFASGFVRWAVGGKAEAPQGSRRADPANPLAALVTLGKQLLRVRPIDAARSRIAAEWLSDADRLRVVGQENELLGHHDTALGARAASQRALCEAGAILASGSDPNSTGPEASGPSAGDALAADYAAGCLTLFIRPVMRQLRMLVTFVTVGLLLLLAAVSSYPFGGKQSILTLCWGIVALLVPVSIIIFVQMERDAVLSMLSGTDPGKLTWSRQLIGRLMAHVVVPLAGIAGAQWSNGLSGIIRAFAGGG